MSAEELAVAALGLHISQLLVMPRAAVYSTEVGVLAGMFGGDVVKESKTEVVRRFSGHKVEAHLVEWSLREPRQGHSLERE